MHLHANFVDIETFSKQFTYFKFSQSFPREFDPFTQ